MTYVTAGHTTVMCLSVFVQAAHVPSFRFSPKLEAVGLKITRGQPSQKNTKPGRGKDHLQTQQCSANGGAASLPAELCSAGDSNCGPSLSAGLQGKHKKYGQVKDRTRLFRMHNFPSRRSVFLSRLSLSVNFQFLPEEGEEVEINLYLQNDQVR